jgi:4-diphosphocytidyl-2-C-methyl-D-erythritol kinase
MQERFDLDSGLAVKLTKRIPSAAGLGGGSSDAAAAVLACNRLFRLGLDFEAMARLGAEIGSDVPFFFSGGQALVQGRGELVRQVLFPFDYQLVLVTPRLAIATAEAYASLKRGLTISGTPVTFRSDWDRREVVEHLRMSGNDFEESLFESHSVLGRIRSALLEAGALLVRLSGSGPTLFGLFERVSQTGQQKVYNTRQWRSFAVRPIGLPREP